MAARRHFLSCLAAALGNRVDIVYPSLSILAEPPVTLVDRNVDKHGTRAVAQAYLDYLYSETGQELAARHMFRPVNEKVLARHAARFPKIALFTLEQAFGNWDKANREHFADGGTFDRIHTRR